MQEISSSRIYRTAALIHSLLKRFQLSLKKGVTLGNIKDKQPAEQIHKLSEREFNLLKIVNLGLQFSTLKDKTISGILYIICYSRFGYPEDVNLVFEIDLDLEEGLLKVTEVSTQDIQNTLDK